MLFNPMSRYKCTKCSIEIAQFYPQEIFDRAKIRKTLSSPIKCPACKSEARMVSLEGKRAIVKEQIHG